MSAFILKSRLRGSVSARIRVRLADRKNLMDSSLWPQFVSIRLDSSTKPFCSWRVALITCDGVMGTSLHVVSFNCRGFKSSEDDINMLAMQADILLLQERWLHKATSRIMPFLRWLAVSVTVMAVLMEAQQFYGKSRCRSQYPPSAQVLLG